jgi:hypothetical protein
MWIPRKTEEEIGRLAERHIDLAERLEDRKGRIPPPPERFKALWLPDSELTAPSLEALAEKTLTIYDFFGSGPDATIAALRLALAQTISEALEPEAEPKNSG